MRSAWIAACDGTVAATVVRQLSELGYSPHRAPDADPGAIATDLRGSAEPEIAVIAAGVATLDRARAIVEAIRALGALDGLPLLLALDVAVLRDAPVLPDVDDVLVAPGTPDELRLRIARAWRRTGALVEGDELALGGLRLNVATHETRIDGRLVELTNMEHRLLRFLLTHPRRVFTREALLERVWGYEHYGATRTVDVQVRRLRAKLGDEYGAHIQTVRSVGYRLER
jgi:DNA-binding response OmpR family regulator